METEGKRRERRRNGKSEVKKGVNDGKGTGIEQRAGGMEGVRGKEKLIVGRKYVDVEKGRMSKKRNLDGKMKWLLNASVEKDENDKMLQSKCRKTLRDKEY